MGEITVYLTDLLRAKAGQEKPHRWFSRLKSFYDAIFEFSETYHQLRRDYEKKYGPLDY